MVAKRVERTSSLRSAEPAFSLSIPFGGSSFMGVQTPEFMARIGQCTVFLLLARGNQFVARVFVVGSEELL